MKLKFDPDSLPPLDIPYILRQAELRPSKGLGQNFLSDRNVLKKIASAADITPEDHVLEIGPGLGSLTRYLAVLAKQVTAVEIDRKLFPILTMHMQPFQNVTLVQGDMLELDPKSLMQSSGYVVAANIPYYITSAIIRHLLSTDCRPARMALTVQYEVARRICSQPGDLSLLALSVQVYGVPSISFRVPAGAFYPPPKVDSAVVRIDLYESPLIPETQMDLFFQVIRAGFSQKRKTLRNSLSGGLHMAPTNVEALLNTAGIDPRRRAETLSIPEWKSIIDLMTKHPLN